MNKIKNKIYPVCDCLCEEGCTQLWERECRAYQFPHSEKERKQRIKDRALCEAPILNWGFNYHYSRRHICNYKETT